MAVHGFRGLCIAAGLSAVLATGLATGLGGCSPIETYRSVRGFTKYDPDPATAPFSGNMAAGEAEDYPNLSTVPPPPTRASTVAERAELTKRLIAERSSTETEAAPLQTTAVGHRDAAAGSGSLTGSAQPGAAQRSSLTVAAATPAAAPAVPALAAEPASQAPAEKAASMTGSAPTTHRNSRQPAEQPPQNSSLQMPEIPSVPAPEAARPAPPPPHLAPPPAVAAIDLPKTAAAAEMPAPAPAAPALAPPPPTIAALSGPKQSTAARQGSMLAAFDLSDPPRLDVAQRASLDKIAAAYRNKPGTVKILAYAGTAADSPDQLGSFRTALDRAQFVASALAQAGVPSNKIQTEASPAAAGAPPGRIEVRLAP